MNTGWFNAVIAVKCFENAVNFENFVSALDRYAVLLLRESFVWGEFEDAPGFYTFMWHHDKQLWPSSLQSDWKIHKSLINHVKTSIMVCGYLDLSDLYTWYSNWKSGVSASRANVCVAHWNWGFEVTKWTVKWSDVLRGMHLFIGRGHLSRNFSQTVSDWVT